VRQLPNIVGRILWELPNHDIKAQMARTDPVGLLAFSFVACVSYYAEGSDTLGEDKPKEGGVILLWDD